MGVKDLWSILSPVCERKSLWELQGKTIAVDLSCWVCDSQNIGEKTVPHMYLRNLFFRANCILMLDALPIFVLEGKAPELKFKIMEKRQNVRQNARAFGCSDDLKKGKRSRLNALLSKCQQLLTIMGLTCINSPGEAEAFCAHLNSLKLVDGCITQDGDCFLYGAQTVYRNFNISASGGNSGTNAGFSIDVFNMSVIEDRLSLGREDLIAISLLCGCDYNEKGVYGVGKDTVLKFLYSVKDENVLNRMRRWRTDLYFDDLEKKRTMVSRGLLCEVCGHEGKKSKHSKHGCEPCREIKGCKKNIHFPLSNPDFITELNIRKRALQDPDFPSEIMINEFTHLNLKPSDINLNRTWNKPDVESFILFSGRFLGWTEAYAVEKFLPLVTRWQIVQLLRDKRDDTGLKFPFSPLNIERERVIRGVKSYEINWNDSDCIVKKVDPNLPVTTVEPQIMIKNAYPELVKYYEEGKNVKSKRVTKKKGKKDVSVAKNTELKMKENNDQNPIKKQSQINRFFGTCAVHKRHVFNDHTNFIESNQVMEEKPIVHTRLQKESDTVKELGDDFSTMNIGTKDPTIMEKNMNFKLPEMKLSGKQSIWDQENNFEKSFSLDICEEFGEEDAPNEEELSVIIDSIVNRKRNEDKFTHRLVDEVEGCSSPVMFTEIDSIDEFDDLADNYVPLIDRIKI